MNGFIPACNPLLRAYTATNGSWLGHAGYMTLLRFLSRSPVALCLLAGLGSVLAHAQSSVVSGRVTDTSGAVISSAAVDMQNNATGIHSKATTNASGYYQFPPLAPGVYTLDTQMSGFAESKVNDIRLEVGGSREINVTLQPAKAQETVTVTAAAPELVVDNPERGNVIESQFVENTPLNIRNPLQLVNFAQGVTAYSAESGNNDQSEAFTNTFRINGGKLATTESLLDGGANTTMYDYNAIAAVHPGRFDPRVQGAYGRVLRGVGPHQRRRGDLRDKIRFRPASRKRVRVHPQ